MSGGKPWYRRALGKILRLIALAAALAVAAALFPYARDWLGGLLPKGKYYAAGERISHEMEKAADLVTVKYTDQGIMEKGMSSLVGNLNAVKAPYTYEIGLGFPLDQVELTPGETGIAVGVPKVGMLYDSFQITDDPEISDFWRLLSQQDYQRMVDEQAAECRERYLADTENLDRAWQDACEQLRGLFNGWAGEELALTFAPLP